MNEKDCTYEGCLKPRNGAQYCEGHRGQLRRGQELKPLREKAGKGRQYCIFVECERPPHGNGLCITHYYQARNGTELRPIRRYARKSPEKGAEDVG